MEENLGWFKEKIDFYDISVDNINDGFQVKSEELIFDVSFKELLEIISHGEPDDSRNLSK